MSLNPVCAPSMYTMIEYRLHWRRMPCLLKPFFRMSEVPKVCALAHGRKK